MHTKIFHLRFLSFLVSVFVLLLSTLSDAKPVAIEERQKTDSTNAKPLLRENFPLMSRKYDELLFYGDGSINCERTYLFRDWAHNSRKELATLPRAIYELLHKLDNHPEGSPRPYSAREIAENPSLGFETFNMFPNPFKDLPHEKVAALKRKYSGLKDWPLIFDHEFYEYLVDSFKALTHPPSTSESEVTSFKGNAATITRRENELELSYYDFSLDFKVDDFSMLKDDEFVGDFLKLTRKESDYLTEYVNLLVYRAALQVCNALTEDDW